MTIRVSRLAPSPTGALHLGNARTFLINWALARQGGWRLLMRIEDLDGPRVKAGSVEQALAVLDWLGLHFDGEPLVQSDDLEPYRDAMVRLARDHRVFRCELTRTQIEQAASAPHKNEHELRFEPHLRPDDPDAYQFNDGAVNYRMVVPDREISIDDAFAGQRTANPFNDVGDFAVWTRRDTPSYQLAVVVDDARQGVTDVVRGADLLSSAARQTLLYEALGLPAPRWWHVPMVIGPEGRRLAKRHGDTRLITYMREGVRPQRVLGLLGSWCGLTDERHEITLEDFLQAFSIDRLPRTEVIFSERDNQWLYDS